MVLMSLEQEVNIVFHFRIWDGVSECKSETFYQVLLY